MKINYEVKDGLFFEGEVIYAARNMVKKSLPFGMSATRQKEEITKVLVDIHGTSMDMDEGTDMILYGVRMDPTTAMSTKDHMRLLDVEFPLPRLNLSIRFGIRTGNSHCGFTPFPEPVLVFGYDSSSTRWGVEAVAAEVAGCIDRIIDTGIDLYYSYIDEMDPMCV